MTDLEKVKQHSYFIQYIKKPSLEVQLAAVKQNIGALDWVTQEFKEHFPEYFL